MPEERREARRVHFPQPVDARLSEIAVSIVDLSTTGASIHHATHVPSSPHRFFQLEFEFDGERFTLKCQVACSRIDQLRSSPNRIVYTSGLRFTDLTERVAKALCELLGNITASHPEVLAPAAPHHDTLSH